MNPERWEKTEEIFRAALDLGPEKRADFLARTCGADAALREEVESLLAADEKASDFLDEPAVRVDLDELNPQREDWSGRILGRWLLVRRIGQGGMGVVYEGKRADGQFKQKVAVKIVKRGMDTDEILHRFQVEKQALASVQHANIASIYDAGSTEGGRPYLVMEFHEGRPIAEHCREQSLGVPDRIALFRQICDAVHCAHQNLVIHRDIKPSNIVVSAEGVPKLLDFGIAKIVQPGDPQTTRTAPGDRFLSPGYASPEQVQGLPVTTASDIYSLGILLEELLPEGTLEDSPELRQIVRMASQREPQRRYASARDLADDLDRFLQGRPVLAQPDTLGYRLKKFVQRNKLAVAAASLVTIATIAGLATTLWQAREKASALEREASRALELQQFAGTLIRETLEKIRDVPGTTQAQADLVRRSLATLDGLFRVHGQSVALRRDLALAYGKVAQVQWSADRPSLGDATGAAESYRREILLWGQTLAGSEATPDDRSALAQSHARLGELHLVRAEHDGAIEHLSRALELAPESNPAWTQLRLAESLSAAGRAREAEERIERAESSYRAQREANPQDAEILIKMAGLWDIAGDLRKARGEDEAALDAHRKALQLLETPAESFDRSQRGSYWLALALLRAQTHRKLGQDGQAETLFRKSVERAETEGLAQSASGEHRRRLAQLHEAYAAHFQARSQLALAIEQLEAARKLYEGIVQIDPADMTARRDALEAIRRIGFLYVERNNGSAAQDALREYFQGMKALIQADPGSLRLRKTLAEEHMRYGESLATWAAQTHRLPQNRKALWAGSKLQYEGAMRLFRELVEMGDEEATIWQERTQALATRAEAEAERLP